MMLRRHHRNKKEYKQHKKDTLKLENKTVAELKDLAKGSGITGYSNMIKDELIEVLGSE